MKPDIEKMDELILEICNCCDIPPDVDKLINFIPTIDGYCFSVEDEDSIIMIFNFPSKYRNKITKLIMGD